MGYFSAQLRPQPLEPPHGVRLWEEPGGWRVSWSEPPPAVNSVQLTRDGGHPPEPVMVPAPRRWCLLSETGGAQVGVAWVRGTEVGPPTFVTVPRPYAPPPEPLCPACRRSLEWRDRLWHCGSGCGARWVAQASLLVDPASLPHGLCTCCGEAQPLIEAGKRLRCPVTQHVYAPPVTEQDYLQAIDKALIENQAKVGLFGLFDL